MVEATAQLNSWQNPFKSIKTSLTRRKTHFQKEEVFMFTLSERCVILQYFTIVTSCSGKDAGDER